MSSAFLPGTDSEGRDGLCVRACVVRCPVERARALSLAAVYWGEPGIHQEVNLSLLIHCPFV